MPNTFNEKYIPIIKFYFFQESYNTPNFPSIDENE
jgi:hypothetical protein